MAPKRTTRRPNSKKKADSASSASAGVAKRKSKKSTLHRLENGLIDVSRESADHLDITKAKANSESPLLRLPAEIRNRIWEYALGGNIRDVVHIQRRRKFYIEDFTAVSRASFPQNSHALLSTCRQIYTETALLTFSTNAFRFTLQTVDWTRHLSKVQKYQVHTVHFVLGELPVLAGRVLPVGIFPNVKHVVVETTADAKKEAWRLTIGQQFVTDIDEVSNWEDH